MDKTKYNKICWNGIERVLAAAFKTAPSQPKQGPFTTVYLPAGVGLFEKETEKVSEGETFANPALVFDAGRGIASVLDSDGKTELAFFTFDDVRGFKVKECADALFLVIRLGDNRWKRILFSVI